MADKKISELASSSTPLGGTEQLAVVQSGDTKKATVENLLTSVQPSQEDNAVVYLNGSKVASTTVFFSFDGTNLGLGTSVPSELVTLRKSSKGAIRFEDPGTSRYGEVFWGTSKSKFVVGSQGSSSAWPISFEVNSSEKMLIEVNGNVTNKLGNFVIGTSGKGIDFSADGSAAGMTSELLDDYEEGTWTPVLTGSTSGTFNGEGRYIKVGSLVTVFCVFSNITTATKPTGNYSIAGLPFTALAGSNPITVPLGIDMSRVTFDAAKIFNAMILAGGTAITLQELRSDNTPTAVTDANFVNGGNMFLRVSGTYVV